MKNIFVKIILLLNHKEQLNLQVKPVDSAVEAGAQVQQLINVECLDEFSEPPLLVIQFL